SSMGEERSASVNKMMSPRASREPCRTLKPLPRLMPFEITRSWGIFPRHDSATAAVRSVEPSSTTMTSVFRRLLPMWPAMRSRVAGNRSSSLNEGMMMESSGAGLKGVPGPSNRNGQEAAQSGNPRGVPKHSYFHGASEATIADVLPYQWGRSCVLLRSIVPVADRAAMERPRPRGWHHKVRIPSAPTSHRRSAHGHSGNPNAAGDRPPTVPVPGGTRRYKLRESEGKARRLDIQSRFQFRELVQSRAIAGPPSSLQRYRV